MLLTIVVRLLDYLLLTLGLLPALVLPFEQVVWAGENVTTLAFPYVHRLWDNDKILPATLTVWKEIDLAYDRLFPYDYTRQPYLPAGCVVLSVASHSGVRQSIGIKTTPAVLMLRCRERINLLRPAQWVSNREQQQYRQGYLLVSMPEMGITDVRVHIVAVKSSLFNPAILSMKHALSRPVTGIFIRHTTNVKQYTFKDTLTGKIERIKATPNHPFYVVNRQRYLPVSDLSSHDKLVNVSGHPVALVCPPGKSSHCGQPYHPGQVIPVYNLEVYGQHRYFVGEPGIMVHNGYKCAECGMAFISSGELKEHAQITTHRSYRCELCDKSYRDSSNLYRHYRIHKNLRTFECKACNKSFNRTDHLASHLKSDTHWKNVHKQQSADALNVLDDKSPVSSESSESSEKIEQARARSPTPISYDTCALWLSDNSPYIPPIDYETKELVENIDWDLVKADFPDLENF